MKTYPYLFRPNLQEIVWGGTHLKPLMGLPADNQPIGESWEVSGFVGKESIVANGPMAGHPLTDVLAQDGATILGQHIYKRYGTELPLLVKIIDAARDLSIQVHPNEALSQKRHGKHGKSEMWYVMQAEPGASLLAGFQQEITPEEYERRVADGTIVDVLARHEVQVGDVFFIPAGRVHALCGGLMVCEIQQSSDVTYRLFDYNRPGLDGKPRQLHTAEAKDALDYKVYPDYCTHYEQPTDGVARVVDCPYFAVNVVSTKSLLKRDLLAEDSFVTLTCLQGQCQVTTAGGGVVTLRTGHSCLIPAVEASYSIFTNSRQPVKLLEAWAK